MGKDRPIVIDTAKLPTPEVVDLFTFLSVHLQVREDDMRIDAARACEHLETAEETAAGLFRDMVYGATGIDQIEAAGHRGIDHGAAQPAYLDVALVGQPCRLLQPIRRDIERRDVEPARSEVDAVAALAAAEVKDSAARGQQSDDLFGESRAGRAPDVSVRGAGVLTRPGISHQSSPRAGGMPNAQTMRASPAAPSRGPRRPC